MTTVFDVAHYILNRVGGMTSMKLQKLVYYSQAWSLAWDDMPLFDDDFEAWANGPVCPTLFGAHKGHFTLSGEFFSKYNPKGLSGVQVETIDIVLEDYAQLKPHELSSLTHSEYPWKQARGDTPPGMPCTNIIEKEVMRDFYAGLIAEQ